MGPRGLTGGEGQDYADYPSTGGEGQQYGTFHGRLAWDRQETQFNCVRLYCDATSTANQRSKVAGILCIGVSRRA